jgi:hypothetical protein
VNSDDEKTFDSIIKTFKDIDLESFKKLQSDKEIIFICGMPRSGTTLVEQIIAAHKDVNGAGELIYLQSIIQKNFLEEKNLNKQKIIDQANSNQNQVQITATLAYYLNNLRSNSTLLGISTTATPNQYAARNILI